MEHWWRNSLQVRVATRWTKSQPRDSGPDTNDTAPFGQTQGLTLARRLHCERRPVAKVKLDVSRCWLASRARLAVQLLQDITCTFAFNTHPRTARSTYASSARAEPRPPRRASLPRESCLWWCHAGCRSCLLSHNSEWRCKQRKIASGLPRGLVPLLRGHVHD